jgi:nucleotide-binding universal stress UspA family protein
MSSGIIVGYDGSECAKEALRVAVEVGKTYGEAVTIVFAYEVNPVGGQIHDYHVALRELATTKLAEASAQVAGAGNVTTEIAERAPAEALSTLARQRDARVIVVGTRGESPLMGALLGTTPHKLLAVADRPVLVVPAAG